jgi:hypothetical protein
VVASAALAAIVLAAVSLVPEREERLLIGRPGDSAIVLDGMSLPADHLGARGRWTRGDGALALPHLPIPMTVSLRLAPPAGRAPDPIEVVVNGLQVHRATLHDGWNDVVLPVARASTMFLRSAVTAPNAAGVGQGLFLSHVTLKSGGLAALRQTPFRTWTLVSLAWLALLLSAWRLTRAFPRVALAHEHADLTRGGRRFADPRSASARADVEAKAARQRRAGLRFAETDDRVGDDGAAAAAVPEPREAGHEARRPASDGAVALVIGAVVILIGAAAIAFRAGLLAHLPLVVALCWAVALGLTLTGTRVAARLAVAPTWRVAIVFLLGAIAALALLFPEAILHGRVLSQADMYLDFPPWGSHAPADYRAHDRPPLGDIPMIVYPFSVFTAMRWREAILPLWTNGISAGQPFLATYQSALFSPFTAILALVPLPQATTVIVAARLLVAGLGMFLFLRALGLSRWAAAFGGLAFQLNGFSLVTVEHPFGGVLPWLPWQLLAGERLPAHRAGSIALLALTMMAAFTGGHPHGALFVAMLGGTYAFVRALGAPDRLRAAASVGVAVGFGVALAAVQIVPFFEYLSLSRAATRRAGFPLNPYFAPLSTLITGIVPNFLGNHGAGNFAGPTNYLEQQIYPGIAVWLLAAVGLASSARKWRTWFFASAIVLAMLVMYAAPGVHQLVSSVPLLKAASLPRIAIITIASLAILAAFGLDRILGDLGDLRALPGLPDLQQQSRAQRRRLTAALLIAGGALIAIALLALRQRAAFLDEQALLAYTTRWTWISVWLTCAVLVLSFARVRGWTGRDATGFALTSVLALDLLLFGYGFHDLIPPEHVYPTTPEIAAVQRDRDLFRVMGLGQALLPDAAMVYGLQDVRGTDGLTVSRYADLLDVALVDRGFLHFADRVSSPLINLLNVKYVFGAPRVNLPEGWFTRVTEGETPVYRNNRVLPRAFLVDGYVVRDGNAARRTLRDGLVDFRRVALLERDPPDADRPALASSSEQVGAAVVTGYRDHEVEIDTDAPGRRLLVLTDVHYPGWLVSIDGQPATLYRANFAFRAVPVPAGRHRIVFAYRPASVRVGLGLSALAGAALIGFVFYERRRAARTNVAIATAATAATDLRSPSPIPPEPVAR